MFDPIVAMLGIIAIEALIIIYNIRWNTKCIECLIFNLFMDEYIDEEETDQ